MQESIRDGFCSKSATSKHREPDEFFIRRSSKIANDKRHGTTSQHKKKVRTRTKGSINFSYLLKLIIMSTVWWCSSKDNCVSIVVTADEQARCPHLCLCYEGFKKIICRNGSLSGPTWNIPKTAVNLEITGYNLRTLKQEIFEGLTNLKTLQLKKNRINHIPVITFQDDRNLIELDLTGNKLTKVPSEPLGHLKNLRTLILRNNPIVSILSHNFLNVRRTLINLDLGELRYLNYVSKSALIGLTKLQTLQMDSCNLRELPLLPLVELRELDLSNNELNMIGSESFAGLKNLEKLILQSSQIAQVEDHAFSNFPSLQTLNLNDNNLSTLKITVFDNSVNIRSLRLKQNPWICNCNLMPLAGYLNDNEFCSGSNCPTCQYPRSSSGKPVTMLLKNKTPTCGDFFINSPHINVIATTGSTTELPCPGFDPDSVNKLVNVNWNLPHGRKLTNGKYRVRVTKLDNGSLNFTSVVLNDTGNYTCSVVTSGNLVRNATVYLNVTTSSNLLATTFFTTTTTSTTSVYITQLTSDTPKSTPAIVKDPVSTTEAVKSTLTTPRWIPSPLPSTKTTTTTQHIIVKTPTKEFTSSTPAISLLQPNDDWKDSENNQVLGATNAIIGCFVSLTLIVAILLIIFYKIRRRKTDLVHRSSSNTADENDKGDFADNQPGNKVLSNESYTKQVDYNVSSPDHPSGSRGVMAQSVTSSWVAALPEDDKTDLFVRLPSSAVRVLPPTIEEIRAQNAGARQGKGCQREFQDENSNNRTQNHILQSSRAKSNRIMKQKSTTLPTQSQTKALAELHELPSQGTVQPLYLNSKMTVKRCKEKSALKLRNPSNRLSGREMSNNTATVHFRPKSCDDLTQSKATNPDDITQFAKGDYIDHCCSNEIDKLNSMRVKSLEVLLNHKETEI